jgi:hydrogenase maturation protein HypF
MLRSGAGCMPTTSMGRLFDAVASLLDVRHDVDHEGQAAMELEALAAGWRVARPEGWTFDVGRDDDGLLLDPRPVVGAAARWVCDGGDRAAAAYAFHEAVADAVLEAALAVRREHGTGTVGLTGGVFQNALLAVGCTGRLEAAGFRVLGHRAVPPNDGGLALGQIAVAARASDG